eukprot:1289186-Pyramimonas_sp.AAC.1
MALRRSTNCPKGPQDGPRGTHDAPREPPLAPTMASSGQHRRYSVDFGQIVAFSPFRPSEAPGQSKRRGPQD